MWNMPLIRKVNVARERGGKSILEIKRIAFNFRAMPTGPIERCRLLKEANSPAMSLL